jgi:zinc transport system permease protein
MIQAIFEYQFMQNAIIAGVLASIICGIIGVMIVEKKLVMMSGGIAHTAYGGVGLGYLLNFPPILGAFFFATAAAFGIGYIKRKGGTRSDVIISMFWSLGMALGILFIALRPGYPPDLSSYLFGNILSVTRADLWLMLILAFLVVTVITLFYQDWKNYLFDEEFAFVMGKPSGFMEYLLLLLVALTVVVLIRVVGIILVISLLAAPAAIAEMISRRFEQRMGFAILFGLLTTLGGLTISYYWNVASGASIVMLASAIYLLFALREQIQQSKMRREMLIQENDEAEVK